MENLPKKYFIKKLQHVSIFAVSIFVLDFGDNTAEAVLFKLFHDY
jgi:hypothetical protein